MSGSRVLSIVAPVGFGCASSGRIRSLIGGPVSCSILFFGGSCVGGAVTAAFSGILGACAGGGVAFAGWAGGAAFGGADGLGAGAERDAAPREPSPPAPGPAAYAGYVRAVTSATRYKIRTFIVFSLFELDKCFLRWTDLAIDRKRGVVVINDYMSGLKMTAAENLRHCNR